MATAWLDRLGYAGIGEPLFDLASLCVYHRFQGRSASGCCPPTLLPPKRSAGSAWSWRAGYSTTSAISGWPSARSPAAQRQQEVIDGPIGYLASLLACCDIREAKMDAEQVACLDHIVGGVGEATIRSRLAHGLRHRQSSHRTSCGQFRRTTPVCESWRRPRCSLPTCSRDRAAC